MKKRYKKVFGVLLCAGVVLVGCGDKDESTICELKQNGNGMDMEITTTIVHNGDTVKQQNQKSIIKIDNDVQYELLIEQMEKMGLAEMTKDMDGVKYKLDADASNKKIDEEMNINLEKISLEDYKKLTNGQADTVKISYEKSVENIKKAGFACE